MSVLVIAGTDTGVGKTVATAALACCALAAGTGVSVCKPVQTGIAAGDDDLAQISRLTGLTDLTGVARYPEPLAPAAAAERAGLGLPKRTQLVSAILRVDSVDKLTLVEGAGGLLVELGADGVTLRDVAVDLGAQVLLVVAPGLGTLNHTALTLEALAAQHLSCAGLVIGAWPARPGVAETGNRDALARMAPLRAVLPAGAGTMNPQRFAKMSVAAFDPDWIKELIG